MNSVAGKVVQYRGFFFRRKAHNHSAKALVAMASAVDVVNTSVNTEAKLNFYCNCSLSC